MNDLGTVETADAMFEALEAARSPQASVLI